MACRLLNHRFSFQAEGCEMRWECERGCGASGRKLYDSPAAAARYAAVFDSRDNADLGRRAPLLGLLPLRIFHRLRSSSGH